VVRSRASAKKAGSTFERQIADYFAEKVDDRIDRAVKRGTKDVGDIAGLRFHGHKIAVEVKNTTKVELSKWAAEAEVERQNLDALAGIVIHKPGDQWVTMTLDNYIALITERRT
jgi:Holliday junction resolvase